MQMSIDAVKQKLMSHTGSSPSSMQLQLKDESGNLLSHLSDNNRLLGYYSPYNGSVLSFVSAAEVSLVHTMCAG